MTDPELIDYLRNSNDPDDRELTFAWDALQRLKAQRDLTPLKTELVEKLAQAVEVCVAFLREDTPTTRVLRVQCSIRGKVRVTGGGFPNPQDPPRIRAPCWVRQIFAVQCF
jgi:YD repeat-containing protein